jgi:hypothetical protein
VGLEMQLRTLQKYLHICSVTLADGCINKSIVGIEV